MMYGDLSNQVGPAIVINADLLVTVKKKWLGLQRELSFLLSTRHLLEEWFVEKDLTIYIVCIGDMAKRVDSIQDMLDTFMTPYTSIIALDTPEELNYLVEAKHVVGYFYNHSTLVNERTTVRKHYQVPNVAEIGYVLSGGERI